MRTQHILVATVRDGNGNPISGEPVEWILARGPQSVGDIVDVGGEKRDNHYALSRTGGGTVVLDRGNADPSDDVTVGPGQAWCVITSAQEGTTDVVAFAPGIRDWDRHKAFAEKHWMDITWEWPLDAVNRVGTPHDFTMRVMKNSDGSPIRGYRVHYTLVSGPAGAFGGQQQGMVETDANGVATFRLEQQSPAVGVNEVEIQLVRPAFKDECICVTEKLITTGIVRKEWVQPSIAIQKSAPPAALVNQPFDYSIAVTNPDPTLDVADVRVTDVLPDGIAYVSSNPPAQVSGQTLTWNLGTLEPAGMRPITVTVRGTRAGRFENCADVAAEGGLRDRACAVTVITAPAIELRKTGPAEVLVCDPITYQLTVTNTGDGPASEVTIRDMLPAGMRAQGTTEFFVGTLQSGESRTVELTVSAERAGTFTNRATATAAGGLTTEAQATTTVRQPVLAITKRAARPDLKTGRPAVFDITVSSTGDVEARDVVLVDTLPAGTRFDSATEGGQMAGNQVVWNLGTLAPGQSRTVQLTVIAMQEGTLRNTATARAYCAQDVTAEAQVQVTGVAAILLEMVDVDDPLEVNGTTTYVIDVTNQGFADDSDVVIECTVPAEQEFVSAQGPTQHTASGKVIRFAPVPQLRPKDRITFRVTVRATGTGDARFLVHLTSRILGGDPVMETESTHQY